MNFRRANQQDVMLTYYWATDPLVRENSFSKGDIKLEDHKDWFLKKITDPNVLFLIAEEEGENIGQLRFRRFDNHSVIGVTIAPLQRGKGYGSKILIEGLKVYQKQWNLPVHAFIKIDNIASIKAFEKAGFELSKELIYMEQPSKLYIWK